MRKPVDAFAASLMLLICIAWGLQQVAIKGVASEVSPMLQVSIRSGIAAVLVWLYSRWVLRDTWLKNISPVAGAAVGGLFAAEFLFIAEGLRWTTASHMAVFLYTAPLFAAIGLHLRIPEERLSVQQWLGVGVSFIGIVVTFLGPAKADAASNMMLGDLIALLAGAAWGMTTVVVRTSNLSEAPAAQTLFYQLGISFPLLLVFAALTGQTHFNPTSTALASMGFQSVVVSFVSYLTWFWLLRKYLAARLGVLSFMTPLFGVLLAMILLKEKPSIFFLVGSALALVGVLVVNTRSGVSPREPTEKTI